MRKEIICEIIFHGKYLSLHKIIKYRKIINLNKFCTFFFSFSRHEIQWIKIKKKRKEANLTLAVQLSLLTYIPVNVLLLLNESY